MPQATSLQVTLSEEALKFVREKVSKGEFASESEVINESVAAMRDHDHEFERWLQEVGGPRYDNFQANPSSGIPVDQVEKNLEQRRKERAKTRP
jgi:antitoxin ParD1/3/4